MLAPREKSNSEHALGTKQRLRSSATGRRDGARHRHPIEGIAKPICKKTAAPPPNSGKNHYLKRLNHASRSAPWNYFRATTKGRHGRVCGFYFWRKQFLRLSLRAKGGRYSKQHEEFMDLTYGHRMASFRGRMEIEAGKQKVEAHLPVDPFFLPLSRVKGAIDIYN